MYSFRIVVDSCHELGKCFTCPGCGYRLYAGIGPGVAVVEIDQNAHSRGLGGECFGDDVAGVAPTARGIDPYPQSDRVDPFPREDGKEILLDTAIVVHRLSLLGQAGQGRNAEKMR